MMYGFRLLSLSVVGQNKPPAELQFGKVLTVISRASDTGKSYALKCIDFALGASKAPPRVKESQGYTDVVLRLTDNREERTFELRRSFAGGDVTLRTLSSAGLELSTEVIPARHSADDRNTLSGLLLGLSGLWGKQLRRNAKGETRGISFRDVAHLCIVKEERIISERPPQLSENVTAHTVESDLFRLLVTGQEAAIAIRHSPKEVDHAKTKHGLLSELILERELELQSLNLVSDTIEADLVNSERARQAALAGFDEMRENLVDLETKQADLARQLREVQSHSIVLIGLVQRFELLERHYVADLNRLSMIVESGVLLNSFPAVTCPVCGSAPEDHRPEDCDKSFNAENVRVAALAEMSKVQTLKNDLQLELEELRSDLKGAENRAVDIRRKLVALDATLEGELKPRIRASTDLLNGQISLRDRLLKAQSSKAQLDDLKSRQLEYAPIADSKIASPIATAKPTTAELDPLCRIIEDLLKFWNYPDQGRVMFAEGTNDIVIAGQPRDSHGKGVRALTCSAVLLGLMQHCREKELPHPSFIAFDSPLLAYREPDPDSQRIREAGVKEAFYRFIAKGGGLGQVIIVENDDPPGFTDPDVKTYHFTKTASGRAGFFPVVFAPAVVEHEFTA